MVNELRLIKGLEEEKINKKLKFVSAVATDTRLMGVVGIVVNWLDEREREVFQIYHLDFEEYGIDGFHEFYRDNYSLYKKTVLSVTGGLGGEFVAITYDEFIYLLKSAHEVDDNYHDLADDFYSDYAYLLEEEIGFSGDEQKALLLKLSPKLDDEIRLINYFVMRLIGNDFEAARILCRDDVDLEDVDILSYPSTLIKNTVKVNVDDDGIKSYVSESLIDFGAKYKLLAYGIKVEPVEDRFRIKSVELLNRMKISSREAALQLKKKEYIMTYNVSNGFFEELIREAKPEVMVNRHDTGKLFIEFNKNNDHVSMNPYYLNGDVYGIYYLTEGNQLVVATFNDENLETIRAFLDSPTFNLFIDYDGEFEVEISIIYDFVNSGYLNFYDFIGVED